MWRDEHRCTYVTEGQRCTAQRTHKVVGPPWRVTDRTTTVYPGGLTITAVGTHLEFCLPHAGDVLTQRTCPRLTSTSEGSHGLGKERP